MNTTTNTTTTAQPAITCDVDAKQGLLNIRFANGKTINMHVSELSEEIRGQAMLHGLKQKLVDAAAISRNTDTGRSASIDDKFDAVNEVADRLLAGQWNKSRATGEAKAAGGLLFKALCRMYATKTPEFVRTFLDGKTKEEQAALRTNAKVAAIIAEIKAEDAKSADTTGESDDLLKGLE
jgi:hypothetical protein